VEIVGAMGRQLSCHSATGLAVCCCKVVTDVTLLTSTTRPLAVVSSMKLSLYSVHNCCQPFIMWSRSRLRTLTDNRQQHSCKCDVVCGWLVRKGTQGASSSSDSLCNLWYFAVYVEGGFAHYAKAGTSVSSEFYSLLITGRQ
jgi:hypothetical protein